MIKIYLKRITKQFEDVQKNRIPERKYELPK